MIRKAVNYAMQNKNSVMFITTTIFMTGILSYFNNNALLCAGILTLIGIICLIRNYFDWKYILFWIAIFYFGFFNSYFKIHNTDELLSIAPSKSVIEGQIVTIPNSNVKGKTKFFFKVNKIDDKEIQAKTLVTVTDPSDDFSEFQIGDFYKLQGSLREPFRASNPSQFDYGKYLRNFDAFTVFYANKSDAASIEKDLTPKWKFLQGLNNTRNKIIEVHAKHLKSPNLEILGGIVFGDDAVAPPDDIKASFINSGLLHILAASGMNVAFIYGFLYFILRKLRVPYNVTILSGIGVIILYTLMTGLGPSVIRAALMLIIILIGKLIDRSTHSVSLLALVALLMLIYNPAFINDVGFQLSFIVTFGLLTMGNILFEKTEKTKIPQWLSGAILIPIIAQIWVAPIQMFYFNTISTYSIFANILSVPFLSIVSFGGFLSSIFAMFTPFTNHLCIAIDFVLNFMISAIVFISNFFAQLPNSLITTTHPSLVQLLIYYLIITVLTLIIKFGSSKKLVISGLSLLLILCLSTINLPNKKLEIIAFDVQNADAFLIKTPESKYFMIDTGRSGYQGSKSQAEILIMKYLKDNGIKNLEGIIITHFDNDHSGGASDLMKNLKVKNIYLNSTTDTSKTSQEIYETISDKNISYALAEHNKIIYEEKDFKMTTFIKNKNSKIEHDNENSIITLLSYKDFDILFMGDAGVTAFNELKSDIPSDIEILKVGHHGGANVVDKQMLNHTKNSVSIISTGRNNFGHPNKGTLDILRNTDIYRTDTHNSIKVISNGESYTLLTFDKEKKKYIKSKHHTISD